jgi:hypothetical protein
LRGGICGRFGSGRGVIGMLRRRSLRRGVRRKILVMRCHDILEVKGNAMLLITRFDGDLINAYNCLTFQDYEQRPFRGK